MAIWKYPEEIKKYIQDNAKNLTDSEIAKNLNAIYPGYDLTKEKVRTFRKNHKIRNGRKGRTPKGYSPVYPKGLEIFVRENAIGRTAKELTELINKEFGEDTITEAKTRAYKKNHKITSGVDTKYKKGRVSEKKGISCEMPEGARKHQFPKGHKPHNLKELKEISKTTDGYFIIKVKSKGIQRERWKFLHRHIWEETNGKIPKGKMVIFLDGDKNNVELSNLALIENKTNLEMLRKNLKANSKEITKVGINIAKLSIAARERKETLKKFSDKN